MELLKLVLVIGLGIFCLNPGKAQFAGFRVTDPKAPGLGYPPMMHKATITARPLGVYTEIGLYLTFSANRILFQEGKDLEGVLKFQLPPGSIVNDSWLWVDTTIIRAKVLERGTATAIYENVVSRRQDPSILTKESPNDYTLKIYPVRVEDTRKIKITYLVPGKWGNIDVVSALPAFIIQSFYPYETIPSTNIRVFLSEPWKNPRLASHPELLFSRRDDPDLGQFYETTVPFKSIETGALTLRLDAPFKNGLFLSRVGDEQKGFYQMALVPNQLLTVAANAQTKHALVLIHYTPTNSLGLSTNMLLEQIQYQLKRVLGNQDYFNVILAGNTPITISKNWIPASTFKLDSVFQVLIKEGINSNDLPSLMAEGIKTVIESGKKDTKILLFSNSIAESGVAKADDLVKELSLLKGNNDVPFFMVDYARNNLPITMANQRYYLGDEYFLRSWADVTKGAYGKSHCCINFEEIANTMVDLAFVEAGTLDIHTSLQNGFCYNRYFVNSPTAFGIKNLRTPILQVGRYEGKGPFVVEFSGSYDGKPFFDGAVKPLTEAIETDSLGIDTWVGNYIDDLERKIASSGNKQEIIQLSIRERVLSMFTSFICLEPALGGEPCLNCLDQSKAVTVGIQELQDSLVLSKISPNPFRERVMIQLKFKELIDLSKAQISVYNHLGQVVRTFSEIPQGKIQDLELYWDGNSDGGVEVPPGVYIFRLQKPGGQYSRKLVKLDR